MNQLSKKNADPILIHASSYLFISAFKSFHLAHQDMNKYTMSTRNGIILVHRDGTAAPPRIFMSKASRCDCAKLRSMQFQCVHELIIHVRFIPEYFGKRWVKRKTLTKSKSKGHYVNPRCYEALSDDMVSCYMNEKGSTEPRSDMNKVYEVHEVMVDEAGDFLV